jgi:RNA polymerase subunit RPABC4/transcription elongation factor Spt4
MNRRDFGRWLLALFVSAQQVPNVGQRTAVVPETHANCAICGQPAVFDNWLDINVCSKCGAHETAEGWQR